MLSKQSEEFLTKLRVELLFRGKSEEQIDEIDEELRDHLTICEQQGKDVSDIIDTPVQIMHRFARHMPFAINWVYDLLYSLYDCRIYYSRFIY